MTRSDDAVTRARSESVAVAAMFSLAAIGLAGVLVPVRDLLGTTNVALVMVLLVVVAASVGGRLSGSFTAVTASVVFNLFHTKPYLTLRVESGKEIVSVVLILVVGLAVGELGVARERQSAVRRSHLRSIRALEEVGAKVSSGAPVDEVWPVVQEAMAVTLGAQRTYFEPAGPFSAYPVVERDGRIEESRRRLIGDGFALPARGAAVKVVANGRTLGQLVVKPDANVGVTREQRRAAVAIADQFAIAVLREPEVGALR
jgi:K+-sensing histidine kinase KdpD